MKHALSIIVCVAAITLAACNLPGKAPASPTPVDESLAATASPSAVSISEDVVDPVNLEYLGAFRLPEGGERPYTYAYGGNAMTFNPEGDPSGSNDGFPGSLFITGHDRLPYGELTNGNQVAEVSIPAPVNVRDMAALSRAEFLQDFQDVTAGHFIGIEEIVRIGMLYLDNPVTGPLIHIAWGEHIQPDPTVPTHGWFNTDLSHPDFQGEWFIAGQSWYSVNDYIFEIPAAWADTYASGRYLATGRFKDGGWSGMGPVVIAYRSWDENGNPPPAGTQLESTTLLHYASSTETDNLERCLSGYQHADEWNGGAWLTTATGQSAVMFAGTKSIGTKYWYGYINPAGAQYPCVDEDVTDFLTCRMVDGSPCPPQDFIECSGHNDYRGWWTTQWTSQFIFYNPADLARVAAGEMAPWEPQPYAVLDINKYLFLNPSGVETEMLGTGDQRRYRIGDVAYDRAHGLLYVLELYADEAAPVVHVWRVR